MAVYIDDANLPYRNMIMCHMIADTTKELLQMVGKIGVNTKWIQDPGGYQEHFDICQAKKQLALHCGAKPIGKFDIGRVTLLRAKYKQQGKEIPSIEELLKEIQAKKQA